MSVEADAPQVVTPAVISIKGNPAISLGDHRDCEDVRVFAPPVCTSCRQVMRWLSRIVGWKAGETRFKAIARAALDADDDILKSLCGTFLIGEDTCERVAERYRLLGLPCILPKEVPLSEHLEGKQGDCDGGSYLPRPLVRECSPYEPDPCGNAGDLDLLTRLTEACSCARTLRPTGANIIRIASILFPNSTAQIVARDRDEICIYLGRPLSELEECFETTLVSKIPAPFCTQIRLVDLA